MRVHKALFAPPPMRPTRSISHAGGGETIARLGKRQRDALHHRARDIGARRRLAHAEQDAARIRIVERRALAAEIGQEEQRAGSGIVRRRLALERVRATRREGARRKRARRRRSASPPSRTSGSAAHGRKLCTSFSGALMYRSAATMSCVAVPSEMKASPGANRAQAHRADRRVAAACREQNAARQAKRVGGLGPDLPAGAEPSNERRRPGGIGLAGGEGFAATSLAAPRRGARFPPRRSCRSPVRR